VVEDSEQNRSGSGQRGRQRRWTCKTEKRVHKDSIDAERISIALLVHTFEEAKQGEERRVDRSGDRGQEEGGRR